MSKRNGHKFDVIKDQPTTPEDISAAEIALREEEGKRRHQFLREIAEAQGRAAQAIPLGPEFFNSMLMYGQLPAPAARWLRSFLQALGDAGASHQGFAMALPQALWGSGGEDLMLVPVRRARSQIYSSDILPWVILLSELIPTAQFDFHAVCVRFVEGYREVSGESPSPEEPNELGRIAGETEPELALADEETAQELRGSGLLGALLKGEG